MQRAVKIRLLPTKEQEILFWKSAGTARWAYNYFLEVNEQVYKTWLENGKEGKRSIGEGEVRKYINNVLKKTTHTWLKGIKSLAIVSNEDAAEIHFYKNINKSVEVRRLEKKLKREQRKASRKLETNIRSHDKNRRPIWIRPLRECKNLEKQNRKIRLIHKRLTDIRNNYLHQTTSEIVKTKPSQIVMEDLNVKGMMKNKYLSEAIAKQKFYEFKRQIQYKAGMYLSLLGNLSLRSVISNESSLFFGAAKFLSVFRSCLLTDSVLL